MTPYIPPGCSPLSELKDGQIRLGIQGPPFSGKTTQSLTFPNPIVGSIDRKVQAHTYRTDVINVPFYDGSFCDKIIARKNAMSPPNRRDAILKWLSTEGLKLSPEQTLIMDNSTGIEEAFHTQYWLEPVYTKQMEIDSFAEWRQKADFFGDLASALKALPCNVVYITHETDDRDKKGELNGGIRPLLTGQAGDKLAGNYTDWFASIVIAKPQDKVQEDKLIAWAKIDKATLNEWVLSTPTEYQAIHLWQTQPDNLRKSLGSTSLYMCPKYVVAHYNTFLKYKKKQTTETNK